MSRFRRYLRSIGAPVVAAAIAVPLIAAGATAALTPRLVAVNHQATADVPLAPVIGTHAAYEVSSLVADYAVAYVGPGAASALMAGASSKAGPTSGPTVDTTRLGDSSTVHVSYTASNAHDAEVGLRMAAEVAYRSLIHSAAQRADNELKGAELALRQTAVKSQEGTISGLDAATTTAVRQSLLSQATSNVATAQANRNTIEIANTTVPDQVKNLRVTVTTLSNKPEQIRVIATSSLSSLIVVIILAFIARRRPGGPAGPARLAAQESSDAGRRRRRAVGQ